MSLELIQPDYNNDFNYPSLTRKDLMYLDSINSRDCPIRKINQINTKRDWSTNLYNLDIEKSVPKKNSVFTNKVDFINKIDDIERARPSKEVILNKPNFNLDISDIERAHPKKLFWNSQRHVNPLNPVYKLPSYIKAEPEAPPKFIRNQIDISDIEKTKPNKLYPMKIRSFKTYDEIKGVHPKKPYVRKEIHDSLNYNDLNIKKTKFRNTNPLEPEYEKPYDGIIEGTKPFLPYNKFIKDNNKNSLDVRDIDGTLPGSSNHYANFRYDNKQRFDTRDIEGAFADTKKYGISTDRCTNPLEPNYQYIGNNELFDCFGELINNGNVTNKHNTLNTSISNAKVNIFDDYNKNINKFKYNNSNNLAYSHDYYNYPKSERRERKMVKSFSCEEVHPKLPLLNLKQKNNNKEESNRHNFLNENEKNQFQENYYHKPFPNYELHHDSLLKLGNGNKNNRLDVKLKKFKKNHDIKVLRKNIFRYRNYDDATFNKFNNSAINRRMDFNGQTEIINNGMGTLYNKLNSHDHESYENKIDNLIKNKADPN